MVMTSLIFFEVLGLYHAPTRFHFCHMPNEKVRLGRASPPFCYRDILNPVQNRVDKKEGKLNSLEIQLRSGITIG